ncbi:hypothetical protein CP532_3424 [Ophiocordyceps camponoti-leonardi (nom. inval.)]|nr:hypothetical protein CP532_3424 [Ophiocordyceps camponoti-leonardi (nom. inval.)]
MAAVLSSADDCGYFGSLRRSRSQSSFVVDSPPTHHYSSSSSSSSPPSNFYVNFYPESDLSSSPPTVQTESTDDGSFSSTPTSNLSVASDSEELLSLDNCPDDDDDDDPFDLPLLSQEKFFIQPEVRDAEKLELSPTTADSSTLPLTAPDTPICIEHAQDDCAVTDKPSRQVDYLSHDWTEEDIWSSWRYVISKRGSEEFPNCQRLENACWRTWSKVKNGLKTISPEELNWLKDCDVTWLYGPLQTGSSRLQASRTESCSQSLSKSESLVNLVKKPILKKRSMSEMMLQRSLTSSSLLKQATAAVQAQETSAAVLRPTMARAMTDCYLALPLCTRQSSQSQETNTSLAASTDSSGISSPCTERKHIHFNEQVEQCIAVEVKCDDDDEDRGAGPYDSDSDDGVVMKRIKPKRRAPSVRRRASKTTQTEGKTIAMLPSTKLKYREDAPESRMTHAAAGSPLLSPSSSQETLRPSRQASAFFFDGDDDDDYDDKHTTTDERATQDRLPSRSPSSASLCDEPPMVGMRRTSSGMLMPCEDDEPRSGDGILGRVLDTVNTARDIAHVIWNVGWRR